ncbi:MAG: response regulator [Desulfomicrobium sp.]
MNQTHNDHHYKILLEIALSISGEFDLQKLLRKCMSIILSKLNCTSVGALQFSDEKLQSVMILPIANQRSSEWMQAALDQADRMEPARPEHLAVEHDGMTMHIFHLQGFGSLVLARNQKLDKLFIKEFQPLANMLARACMACREEERRQATELQLASLQATQESLLNNLPFMVWMKDNQGRYTAVNKAYTEHLGISSPDVIGRTTNEIWPTVKAQTFMADDAKVRATGTLLEGLDSETDSDGETRWYEYSKRPLWGKNGVIVGTTGFRSEVTDRIRIEQNLAYRTAFQKVVMDLAIDFVNTPLMELDQGINNALAMIGKFAEVDRAYLFRYDFKARTMNNTHEWCAPGINPEKDNLQNVRLDQVPDWVAAHCRGDLVHVADVSALPEHDPLRGILEPQGIRTLITLPLFHSSNCFGFAGFDAVRTQKNWSPDEITLLKVMTVLLTNAENRRLHEQRLVEARAAAEAASLAKSEFLANMSHEIRTPLYGTVSMIELLKDTHLNTTQMELLEMAESSAESLLNVINDILDFSKIEAGKLELTPRLFDLEEESYRLAGLVSAKAMEKDVEVLVRLDPAAPHLVEADNLRLRQVLSNLLFNAVKFTNSGHILLNIQCVDIEEGRTTLLFSVEDTGIGIPADRIPIIFDQFAQVDGSTSRRHGGTGLGLAICQQLVQLMGGNITVSSAVGKGSTFSFELKLSWKRLEEHPPGGLFTLRGHRALIVDDMTINRRILSEYLTNWGVEHDSASNALGALRLLAQAAEAERPYSFILLDHAMPGMDGLELARTLYANGEPSSPRVILMSSKWGALSSDQCVDMGIWACLPKPVAASDLFNAIGECLLGQRGQGCATDEETASEREKEEPKPGPARGHVLVVDDHRINRKTAVLLLEKLGFRVSTAENGLDALGKVRCENFDMVFMDVQMPMMDGYETSRAIRAMGGKFASMPIIALTANAMDNDRERCLDAGMSDYLPKPLPWDRLLAVLQKHERPRTQETTPEVELIDFHHHEFLSRYNLELDIAREILQDFLTDGPSTLDDILRAMKRRDASTAALAHRFKGPCSYVGAQRLRSLCTKIMIEAERNHWDQTKTLAQDLDSAWRDFTTAARYWLDGTEQLASKE